MKIIVYCLFQIIIVMHLAHGIAFDGTHVQDDYINLSYERPSFDAACSVIDKKSGISLTGVLVKNRVVMTAAHAFDKILSGKIISKVQENNVFIIPFDTMYVEFKTRDANGDEYVQKIKVVAAIVDVRYYNGEMEQDRTAKFDFAYLVLDGKPDGVDPVLFLNQNYVSNDALLTVVSYGTADALIYNPVLLRRAFRLYERDTYYGNGRDPDVLRTIHHVQESSLYFKPMEIPSVIDRVAEEETARGINATQNWIKDGKKPYGLALPGTSGSPVFVHIDDKVYLLALISSFAHITGIFKHRDTSTEITNIVVSPKDALGEYHTIYSLPYNRSDSQYNITGYKKYMMDEVVLRFLNLAEMTAQQYKEVKYTKKKKMRFFENPWVWLKTKIEDEFLS